MATRIKEKYLAEAVPALKQKFGYKNVMEIPKLSKIVINMGLGDCKDNAKAMEMAVGNIPRMAERISGAMKPTAAPQDPPHKNPHSRTGRCMGSRMEPNWGMFPVKFGRM